MNFVEKWGRLKVSEPVDVLPPPDPTPADEAKDPISLTPCPVCHEYAWWESIYGRLICFICHPPGPGAVKRWIGDLEACVRMKAARPAVMVSLEEFRQRKMQNASNDP